MECLCSGPKLPKGFPKHVMKFKNTACSYESGTNRGQIVDEVEKTGRPVKNHKKWKLTSRIQPLGVQTTISKVPRNRGQNLTPILGGKLASLSCFTFG